MQGERAEASLRVCVVGSGYVGTVAAACFSLIGHRVTVLEADQTKLQALRNGKVPFYEPGLEPLVQKGLEDGLLSFTDDPTEAVRGAVAIFLCVGTPARPDGRPDLTAIESATRAVGAALDHSCVLVTKSTVPIGSGARFGETVARMSSGNGNSGCRVSVASNPEFLREGDAVGDFLCPDRIVIGSEDPAALDTLAAIYRPVLNQSFPGGRPGFCPALLKTDLTTAETIKYAANAFLATKISLINEIAQLCAQVGADVVDLAGGIGLDERIGSHFLSAGIGWGGSCFGKDIDALTVTLRDNGLEPLILDAVRAVNANQRRYVVGRIEDHFGDLRAIRVSLLGLSFKPGTDDLRDAPSLDIIAALLQRGAEVVAFDPAVNDLPGLSVEMAADAPSAVDGADAVVVVTDWPEFARLKLDEVRERMRGRVFIDGRNLFDPETAIAAGLDYEGIGRRVATSRRLDPV